MDGLSSDFTSASPFIAPELPGSAQTHGKPHINASVRLPWRISRTERAFPPPSSSSSSSVFCLLAGKGRAHVTSLLREKHAWSICFDCGLLQIWRRKATKGPSLTADTGAVTRVAAPRRDLTRTGGPIRRRKHSHLWTPGPGFCLQWRSATPSHSGFNLQSHAPETTRSAKWTQTTVALLLLLLNRYQ